MLFKLCRYLCPVKEWVTGMVTSSPLHQNSTIPQYLQPYKKRPRHTPIINTTANQISIEDPSNGFMDKRGIVHYIVHVGNNKGGSLHSKDGVSWFYNFSKFIAFPNYISYRDGTNLTLQTRQEPKLLLDSEGQPTHLICVCGPEEAAGERSKNDEYDRDVVSVSVSVQTFVCIQPLCTDQLLSQGQCA